MNFNESENNLTISVENFGLVAQAHIRAHKWIFYVAGFLNVHGSIDNVEMTCKVTTFDGKVGTTPKLAIIRSQIDINPDKLDIKIDHSIAKMIEPIINANLFGIKSWIIGQVKDQFENNGVLDKLAEFINNEINDNMVKSIDIPEFGIGLSVLPTDDPKVYSNGIELKMEGITFPTAIGYEKLRNCEAMTDNILANPDRDWDIVAQIGQCAVMTLIDTLIKNKFTQTIVLPTNSLITGDPKVTLMKWDQQAISFKPNGEIDVKISMELVMEVQGNLLTVDTNLSGIAHVTKASDIIGLVWSQKEDRLVTDNDKIGSLLIEFKVAEIDDLNFVGSKLPAFVEAMLRGLLEGYFKSQNMSESVDIPQICIFRDSCVKSFDIESGDDFGKIKFNVNI